MIQRYTAAVIADFVESGNPDHLVPNQAVGRFVEYEDHQQALDALEARIIELEAIVEAVSHLSAESHSPWADVIRSARAALSLKEPAPQQSDNLKQPVRARVDSGA
jgi:hypothetical protein